MQVSIVGKKCRLWNFGKWVSRSTVSRSSSCFWLMPHLLSIIHNLKKGKINNDSTQVYHKWRRQKWSPASCPMSRLEVIHLIARWARGALARQVSMFFLGVIWAWWAWSSDDLTTSKIIWFGCDVGEGFSGNDIKLNYLEGTGPLPHFHCTTYQILR